MYKNIGADGIKTGYLAVEKYSLASSIKKKDRRLIAVASGFNTKNDRSRQSIKLLTWGITNFDLISISKKNEAITELDVWLGKKDTVKVYTKDNISQTIKKARKKKMRAVIEYNGPIEAPIQKDQKLGVLKVFFNDELLSEHNVFALNNVQKVNLFSRLIKSINYLIWGDV